MLRQLIKLLMRSGNKKGMNQLLKTHGSKISADDVNYAKSLRGNYLPHKSTGTAGVKTKAPRFSVEDWVKRNHLKSSDAWAGYKGYQPVNPLKSRIRERILQMRKNPGMAKGLQRLESRKASALNTPGTPWRNKALRYEPTVGRAANFNSLFAKDKDFRKYLKDWVGRKKMADLTPKMRDDLAKRYLDLKRRGLSEAESSYKAVMEKARNADYDYGHPIWGKQGVDW